MVNTKLIIGTEILSLFALALIFFKVLFMTPWQATHSLRSCAIHCFNVGDGYARKATDYFVPLSGTTQGGFTILPLFMTKALELAQIIKK